MVTELEISTDTASTFGRYRLLEKLGQGGMAVVYRAEMSAMEVFSRIVALKVLHLHLAMNPEFAPLFISEARLGGYLSHPNIVGTLDFGEHDKRLYLAMEYVDGPTLDHVLKKHKAIGQPIPLDIVLQIMVQVCNGLDYAHSATNNQDRPLRIVHRDLKPSNILLSRHGLIKVADFGVARAESNLAQTQFAGALRGTPLYLSPEQAWGLKELDYRSDLFSVGLILFELLTLTPLYQGDSSERVLRFAQDGRTQPRLNQLPDMPARAQLLAFLARTLSYSPDDRYLSAANMVEALETIREAIPQRLNLKTWLLAGFGDTVPGTSTTPPSSWAGRPPVFTPSSPGTDRRAGPSGSVISMWRGGAVPDVAHPSSSSAPQTRDELIQYEPLGPDSQILLEAESQPLEAVGGIPLEAESQPLEAGGQIPPEASPSPADADSRIPLVAESLQLEASRQILLEVDTGHPGPDGKRPPTTSEGTAQPELIPFEPEGAFYLDAVESTSQSDERWDHFDENHPGESDDDRFAGWRRIEPSEPADPGPIGSTEMLTARSGFDPEAMFAESIGLEEALIDAPQNGAHSQPESEAAVLPTKSEVNEETRRYGHLDEGGGVVSLWSALPESVSRERPVSLWLQVPPEQEVRPPAIDLRGPLDPMSEIAASRASQSDFSEYTEDMDDPDESEAEKGTKRSHFDAGLIPWPDDSVSNEPFDLESEPQGQPEYGAPAEPSDFDSGPKNPPQVFTTPEPPHLAAVSELWPAENETFEFPAFEADEMETSSDLEPAPYLKDAGDESSEEDDVAEMQTMVVGSIEAWMAGRQAPDAPNQTVVSPLRSATPPPPAHLEDVSESETIVAIRRDDGSYETPGTETEENLETVVMQVHGAGQRRLPVAGFSGLRHAQSRIVAVSGSGQDTHLPDDDGDGFAARTVVSSTVNPVSLWPTAAVGRDPLRTPPPDRRTLAAIPSWPDSRRRSMHEAAGPCPAPPVDGPLEPTELGPVEVSMEPAPRVEKTRQLPGRGQGAGPALAGYGSYLTPGEGGAARYGAGITTGGYGASLPFGPASAAGGSTSRVLSGAASRALPGDGISLPETTDPGVVPGLGGLPDKGRTALDDLPRKQSSAPLYVMAVVAALGAGLFLLYLMSVSLGP